jgi:hypothetical protein
MAPDAIYDLSEDHIFDKNHWVRLHGKNYPTEASEVPPELQAFRDAAMKIPDTYRMDLIPASDLSIQSLLSIDLPAKRVTLVSVSASKQFTSDTPLTDVSCLKTRKLPSIEFVTDAAKNFGQALLNDAQGIIDPNYKGQGLPVWAVQYWIEMHQVLMMRALWKGNLDWLDSHSKGSGVQGSLDQTRALLLALPWTVELHAEGSRYPPIPGGIIYTSAEDLTRMLSDRMLLNSLVDVMVETIAARVRGDLALSMKYEIVDLIFFAEISKAEEKNYWRKKSSPYLRRLEEKLKGSGKRLVFPVHLVAEKHFNAFEIDYASKKICYGKYSIRIVANTAKMDVGT